MITWPIYICFAVALVMILPPRKDADSARYVALGAAIINLVFAIAGVLQLENPGEITTVIAIPWIESLGIEYHLAVDGISAVLVILTAIAALAGVLFSWNVEHRPGEFFALYFALLGGVFGVFLSFDLFLLFVFYEIAIIPKYFLIAIWGSTNRQYGAMKLALYSFAGSALVLVGLVAAYALSPAGTFNYGDLAETQFASGFQAWAFPVTFIGFAVLAGLWPFHTWAPTGHVAAPTAASMLLAGVVMKLGAYGALRVSMVLFPEGFQMWQGTFATLAVIGIVYGAMVALTQRDFKFVIGYSSVSHMGFVLLGLMAANLAGLSGAVLQMFSHGIIAGLLFAVVGRMVYDRTHTRDLSELEGFRLSKQIPFAGITFLLAGFASMGFPGFSGFVAEVSVLMGAWERFPVAVMVTVFGILVVIAFTLRAMLRAFFTESETGAGTAGTVVPITLPEKAGAFLLLTTTILIGIFPWLLLDLIVPAVSGGYFQALK